MTRRSTTIPAAWFEQLYANDPDPWCFATSDYEREKYAATLSALPRARYANALEVGCSIGVLTAQLVRHCDTLLAIDGAPSALAQARLRCPTVRFECRHIPDQWPDGRFDLILLSEVLYYLDHTALDHTAKLAAAALMPGGCILLVHYLGSTDYPMTGDQAADAFIAAAELTPAFQSRQPGYRLDRLEFPPVFFEPR